MSGWSTRMNANIFFYIYFTSKSSYEPAMLKLYQDAFRTLIDDGWYLTIFGREFLMYLIFMPHLARALCLLVCVSFRSSVCLSRFRWKFLDNPGSFWWGWNPIKLKFSTHVPYAMIFLILMPNYSFYPIFTVHWT